MIFKSPSMHSVLLGSIEIKGNWIKSAPHLDRNKSNIFIFYWLYNYVLPSVYVSE